MTNIANRTITSFNGKVHEDQWSFPIAMLNYQRVTPSNSRVSTINPTLALCITCHWANLLGNFQRAACPKAGWSSPPTCCAWQAYWATYHIVSHYNEGAMILQNYKQSPCSGHAVCLFLRSMSWSNDFERLSLRGSPCSLTVWMYITCGCGFPTFQPLWQDVEAASARLHSDQLCSRPSGDLGPLCSMRGLDCASLDSTDPLRNWIHRCPLDSPFGLCFFLSFIRKRCM